MAAQTGLSPTVLRSWQDRFGYPEPNRAPSGHRRFSDHDVEQIRQIINDRDGGLSLEAAIARARRTSGQLEQSIFAAVRHRHPELASHSWTKRAMLAVSRAIEDECASASDRPLLIGSFQRVDLFSAAEARWEDLVGRRGLGLVFADFERVRRRSRLFELPTKMTGLDAEWAVTCVAPGVSLFMAGRERPGQATVAPMSRHFEACWSADPEVVRDAALVGLALARACSVAAGRAGNSLLVDPAEPPAATIRRAVAVANRMVSYLDADPRSPGPA